MSCRGASGSGSRARTVKLFSALTPETLANRKGSGRRQTACGLTSGEARTHDGSVCIGAGVVDHYDVTDRIVIEGIRPSTPSGYPAKAVVGRAVPVTADVFRDGHDIMAA